MNQKQILEVTVVDVQIQKSNPVQYLISAEGYASSSGWTKPELAARSYTGGVPADGIQDFDFLAIPPSGHANPSLHRHEASVQMPDSPKIHGIRIHARLNSLQSSLKAYSPSAGASVLARADLGSGEMPAGLIREVKIPIFITGTISRAGLGFCMDGASHHLHHAAGVERIRPRSKEVYDILSANEDGKTLITIGGYRSWGAECSHISAYSADQAQEMMKLADDRFVPFPMKLVPSK